MAQSNDYFLLRYALIIGLQLVCIVGSRRVVRPFERSNNMVSKPGTGIVLAPLQSPAGEEIQHLRKAYQGTKA